MPKIVHTLVGKVVGEYPLESGTLTIGRSPENDIRLDDVTVSGRHALISSEPSTYMEGVNDIHIEDLNSTNGTVIDGKNIKRCMLKHNDVIEIGMHEFTFVDEESLAFDKTVVFVPGNNN